MKSKIKAATLFGAVSSIIGRVFAHPNESQDYYGHMMWNGGWVHNTGHLLGYNMWGMGWFGLIFGLLFWALVILGIIYLYQQITSGNKGSENED